MITLRAAARAARDRLLAAGVAEDEVEAEIEAEVLLRYALEISAPEVSDVPPARPTSASGRAVSRSALYARYEDEVEPEVAERFEALVTRRLGREPSAYITGRREFYGLEFKVTPDVLIPRPETEGLIEAAIKLARYDPQRTRLRIADIGTGSGAIAVTLAQLFPRAEVYATDVSRAALDVAAENARRHGVGRRIAFRAGHLMTPLYDYVDLLVANLPYVTTQDWSRLESELREHEPRLALDGGDDGLDLIRDLLQQAPRYLHPGGHMLLEIGEGQVEPLAAFMRDALPPRTLWTAEVDFAGIPRVLSVLSRGS